MEKSILLTVSLLFFMGSPSKCGTTLRPLRQFSLVWCMENPIEMNSFTQQAMESHYVPSKDAGIHQLLLFHGEYCPWQFGGKTNYGLALTTSYTYKAIKFNGQANLDQFSIDIFTIGLGPAFYYHFIQEPQFKIRSGCLITMGIFYTNYQFYPGDQDSGTSFNTQILIPVQMTFLQMNQTLVALEAGLKFSRSQSVRLTLNDTRGSFSYISPGIFFGLTFIFNQRAL